MTRSKSQHPSASHFVPLDPGRIDTLSQDEMQYWSKELHCTEDRLVDAVSHVGNHVTAVREHLAAHHREPAASHRHGGGSDHKGSS